jgi:glycosyltransferase involved in cell wall biosynthesis
MKLLIATDAWEPQVNGVVRTLQQTAREAAGLDVTIEFITPAMFPTVAMPGYPEIPLALATRRAVARRVDAIAPDAIHIATEGPVGLAVRGLCIARGLPFTSSFHTRFPDYLAGRLPLPARWTEAAAWSLLRWFHGPAAATMAATPTLAAELEARGFKNVKLWQRGVDATLFTPERAGDLHLELDLPRPVFLTVGRLAVEKNVEAFLALDLPGTKLVVGDGPARAGLEKRFPGAVFLGARRGEELARIYASADVFVFPSRTDTFGLVLLEALASGLPVAAFPAPAPRDVLGLACDPAAIGALDEDLRAACLKALTLSREDCRAFALTKSWQASTRALLDHVTQAVKPALGLRARRRAARIAA